MNKLQRLTPPHIRGSLENGYCVLARIRPTEQIEAIQSTLRGLVGYGDYLDPSEFHITMVYAAGGNAEQWQQLCRDVVPTFSVLVDGVGVFETPDGYAVHLNIRREGLLFDAQAVLVEYAVQSGFELSEYSIPADYKPHITLGYFTQPVEAFEITPFALTVDAIDFCAPDHSTLETYTLRSAKEPATPQYYVRFISEPDGELDGYLAIWGSSDQRDSYNTWFDKNNPPDLGLKDGEFLPVRLMYEHGQDDNLSREIVGKIVRVWMDNVGIRFRGFLDKASEGFDRVVDEIRKGLLKISSGSAEHLAEFDEDGRFVTWYLSEVSLTQNPAEPNMRQVALVRSATGIQLTQSVSVDNADSAGGDPIGSTANATGDGESEAAASIDVPQTKTVETKVSKRAMKITLEMLGLDGSATPDQIFKALADYLGDEELARIAWQKWAGSGSVDAPVEDAPEMMSNDAGRSKKPAKVATTTSTENADVIALRAQVEALENKMKTAEAEVTTTPTRSNGNANITVSEPRKYWNRSLSDLMFVHEVEKARGIRPSPEFVQVIAGRTATALEKNDTTVANPAVRSLLKATRADEIVTSTNTGNGDEWIGVAYSGTLWEKARNNRIYQQLVSKGMRVEEVAQGMESVVIFTEGSDPTVYTITQSADLDATGRPTVVVPVTAPGTGQVTLTPGYLGMAVAYTSVFEEDSLIAAASQLNAQMNEKAEETIEQLFLNGDTASTLNVNYDGGTANAAQYFLASNGARKYALVTGSGTSRSGGALDEDDFRLTLKLFPSAIRTRKKQIAFIFDSDTHNTALGIPALKTDDVRHTQATITSGVLENIYGVDTFESGFMPLTDTDGKVTYNAAGTVGTILGVYAPFWAMGWKRRVTFETSKDILAQTNLIVATFRLGFLARGAGAAVATYNLTIA